MTKFNSIQKIVGTTILVVLAYTAVGQTIDPTVEVQRDFDGRMVNIHKSHLKSSIHDSLSNFNLSFNYSIFNKPYKDLYEFSPLPSAELHNKVEEKLPVFMAKGSLSFPLSPLAGIYFQPRLKGGHILQFNTSYHGFFGKLNTLYADPNTLEITKNHNMEVSAPSSSFTAGGRYGYNWKKGELYLDLGYNANSSSYYGFYTSQSVSAESSPFYQNTNEKKFMKDSCSHRWQQLIAKFHIASVNAKGHGAKFHYKADMVYSHTSDKLPSNSKLYNTGDGNSKLDENYIRISGELGPTFGKYNRIAIEFNSENVFYNGIKEYRYGLYEITPQYAFEKGRVKLRAGVKISGRYKSKESADMYHNALFLKGNLTFEAARNTLWLYADIDGGNRLNNYSSLLEGNRWLSQNAGMEENSIPLLAKGGLRGHIHGKFSYNLYAKYAIYEGLLQYVGNIIPDSNPYGIFDSRLNTIYSNHREFSIGGDLNWHTKDFTAGTRIEYSDYTDAKKSSLINGIQPLGYAPFKWYTHASYNYRERIWISAAADFRSAAPTWISEFSDRKFEFEPFLDLSINVQYAVNRNLSVFLMGENLLNRQIQYYPQYIEKGCSFGAGLLVKL